MKKLLLLALVAIMVTGCVTQKKCNDKFPPITIEKEVIKHDTLFIKETSHDTTFIVKAGKDTTVVKTDTVIINNGISNSKKVTVDGKYASAYGQVLNSTLVVKLEERSYDLEVKLKDALKTKYIYKAFYEKERNKQVFIVKQIPPFYKFTLYFFIGTVIYLLAKLILKYKLYTI